MEKCKNCSKVIKLIGYPDEIQGFEYVLKTETFNIFQCADCGAYIKNFHKRYGYQTEYMPVNEFIESDEFEKLKVLDSLLNNE